MRLRELRFDWKVVTVIVVSTLVLVINKYHRIFDAYYYDMVLLYLIIPLLTIVLFLRESPAQYGFRLGDWKAGLALTAVAIAGITLVMPFIARTESFQHAYAGRAEPIVSLLRTVGLEMVGWEFLFRGFLLFALYRVCGAHAIVLQAVPFALMHIGKPELETLSTLFGGSAFGYVAWRTNSFVFPFLIHLYLAVLTIVVAGGAI